MDRLYFKKHTRLCSCCPPPRLRLSCCCCGDMLSIQPDARRLTVRLSSDDAEEREIPLTTSVSGTHKPSQHKLVRKSHRKLLVWRGEEGKLDLVKKKKKKLKQLSLSLSSPSMNGCAVTPCLDYQLRCHFLMRLYAHKGGGAITLQEIGSAIFKQIAPFIP